MLDAIDAKPLARDEPEDLRFLNVAGWRTLARIPGTTALKRHFLRVYSESVARDEKQLRALTAIEPDLPLVQNRLDRAIRTVAAFDAWYALARWIGRHGRDVSVLLAVAAVFPFAAWRHVDSVLGIVAVVLALITVLALRFVDGFYRTWRARALYSTALAVVVVALDPVVGRGTVATAPILLAAETFLVAQAVFALAAYSLFTVTTWFKTTRYPEHEVVQSLINAASRSLDSESFRRPTDRARMVADLEWVALRLERDFVARFRLGDAETDAWFRQRGAECAAAIRRWEKKVAFPTAPDPAAAPLFIIDCLNAAARGSWGTFPREDTVAAPRRKRVIDFVRAAAVVLLPAVAAIALYVASRLLGGDSQLADKLLYVGLGFSFLSLLANIDPQRFDAQVGAARALGESAKR